MRENNRIIGLDQIRGIGVILMIIFHFCYDLKMHQLPSIPGDSTLFWYWLPRLIVFIFLFCVGAALRMAHQSTIQWRAFFNRFLKIAGAAFSISIVTYFLYPSRWVYFGTLHCIALCSFFSIAFIKWPKISLFFSISIITPVVFFEYKYPWIDLGHPSMDYEPFLPWFYVCLLGIYVESTGFIKKVNIPNLLGGNYLLFLGKKALIIYLIHQPILFGLTYLLSRLNKL